MPARVKIVTRREYNKVFRFVKLSRPVDDICTCGFMSGSYIAVWLVGVDEC